MTRRGGRNLYSEATVERAWGHTHKNRKSNGGLTSEGIQKDRVFTYAAGFDSCSIFSKEIKETG